MKKQKKTKQEKVFIRRGILVTTAGVLLALASWFVGSLLGKAREIPGTGAVLTVCCALPPVLLAVSLVLSRRFMKRFEAPDIAELNRVFLLQQENAQQTSEESVAFLRRWRRLSDAYAVLLGLLGALIAFCAGLRGSEASILLVYAMVLLIVALSRIRFPLPTAFMDDEDSLYVTRGDYPELYALAEKAAAEMGCGKTVRISLLNDGNVGIADYGNTVSLQIGVYLMNVLSDRELYAILLHEFSHITDNTQRAEERFNSWLEYGQTPTLVSWLTQAMFLYLDAVSSYRYTVFQLATSVLHEAEADRAMLRAGDSAVAASALLKTYYFDRFEFEKQTCEGPGDFVTEQIRHDLASGRLARFREQMALRAEVWNGLVSSELLARNATHPTLKMRMEALGVSQLNPLPDTCPPEYEAERAKALTFMDAQIVRSIGEDYPALREDRYLAPLRTVEQWETEGRPLIGEKYRDVVEALEELGRFAEAEALCERAIRELPDAAAMFACYEKGRLLLHRYDPEGIAYIYRAVEGNHNFSEVGMDEIGTFCCTTGNEAELERCRARWLELAQKEVDEYGEIGQLNKGDDLGPEQLPEGVLEEILAHICSFEAGSIDKIYLVRKTISPELFTSAFVIRFVKDCDPELHDEVMHQIFSYLDTVSDWQYSLFDYDSVKRVKVEAIEGSLVYRKDASPGSAEP